MNTLFTLIILAALFFITGRFVHAGVNYLYARIGRVVAESENPEVHAEAVAIIGPKTTDHFSAKLVRDLLIYIEVGLFSILTVVMLTSGESVAEIVEFLGIASSVWLSLKVVGNHQQWSYPYLGRATFYVFLIGSIASILRAMFLGYIAWLLLF